MKQEYLRLEIEQLMKKSLFIGQNEIYQDLYRHVIEQVLNDSKFNCLLQIMYLYDTHLFEHSINTSLLSMFLALDQQIPSPLCKDLAIGGLFHDLGKVLIPLKILQKTGPLSEDEWRIMKLHPEYGYEIIRAFPVSSLVLEVILYHHCGYILNGYPKIIYSRSEQWQLIQIVTIADAFDAMVSKRTYRKDLPLVDIYREIKNNLGKQFEPVSGNLMLDLISQHTNLKKGEVLPC